MAKSKIEWTESSWNPVTGCTKISPGCKNCYAERMAKRLKLMGQLNYVNGFEVALHGNALNIPLKMKKPQMIFVNSMSDLFHGDVPFEFIQRLFEIMKQAHWHKFQVLTKRSGRLLELNDHLDWSENVWMGVSVENNDFTYRIENLKKVNAAVKFISFEPLIGPVMKMDFSGIDWVIVGGESGYGARSIDKDWVKSIRDNCVEQKIPFFFKQWGGVNKKKTGRLLEGEIWDQMPAVPVMK
jgi:protein gp37